MRQNAAGVLSKLLDHPIAPNRIVRAREEHLETVGVGAAYSNASRRDAEGGENPTLLCLHGRPVPNRYSLAIRSGSFSVARFRMTSIATRTGDGWESGWEVG